MAQQVAELQEDHRRARHALKVMKSLTVQSATVPDYRSLEEAVSCLSGFMGRAHRSREEAIFEGMTACDPTLLTLQEEMRRSHRELEYLCNGLLQAMDAAVTEAPPPATQVWALCRRYLQVANHHIDIEEDVIFPLADRLLDDHDWAVVEGKVHTRSWRQTPRRLSA